MSELNIGVLPSGFVGIEQENQVKNTQQETPLSTKQAESMNRVDQQDSPVAEGLTASETKETVQEVNDILQSMQRNLSFSVDEQLGESVILVKDSESEEVIRQIPSEELVVLRKKMDDVVGILFDTKV